MATVAAVIASTHHPFYLKAARHRQRAPALRRRVGRQDRGVPGDADPRRARRPGDGRQRPLPPAVARQHAAVPGRQGAVLRRQLVQRGARVRPATDEAAGQEDLSAHILRNGLDMDFDLAFSNELRIDHSITCPIITLRPQADLPIVPIYTNIFAPPLPQPSGLSSWARRSANWWSPGRATYGSRSSAPDTSRSSSGSASVRRARPRPCVRPQSRRMDRQRRHRRLPGRRHPRQPAPAGQRHPRLHGLHADDGRRRRGREGGLRRLARPLPHHGGLLHLVSERSARMSKYLLNKFLYTVDRDPTSSSATARTLRDRRLVGARAGEQDPQLSHRRAVDLACLHRRRARALRRARPRALFEMGAHPFLTLTLFIAMFERDHGPLEYQIAYGARHEAPLPALPRHRDLTMHAAVLHTPGPPPNVRRAPRTRSGTGDRLWSG